MTAPSVSLDPAYSGVDPADVAVRNVDNEGGGITVWAQNVTTTEAGAAAHFMLALNCRPTADVTVPVASSDTGEVMASPAAVTFTPGNWSFPATVTLTGVDDPDDDGDQTVVVTVGPATSADLGFDGATAPPVSVTNVDND